MAIHVEDHPSRYGTFEGTIPPGQYGAGTVIVWDRGTWEPVGDPRDGLAKGKLMFQLHGQKLAGLWELVRIAKPGDRAGAVAAVQEARRRWARPHAEYDVITRCPTASSPSRSGRVEEREPRGATAPRRRAAARPKRRRCRGARKAAAARHARAAAGDARRRRCRPAATGSSRSSSTATACWRASTAARCGSSRAAATTGPAKMQRLAAERSRRSASQSAWLDGEIVVLSDDGMPDFNALQNAFDNARSDDIVYFLFDLPFLDGNDLRQVPLAARRARAARSCSPSARRDRVRFSAGLRRRRRRRCCESACQLGLEGVIAKRADAPYVVAPHARPGSSSSASSARSSSSCGFTDRTGARARGRQPAARLPRRTASCATAAASAPAGTRSTRPRAARAAGQARDRQAAVRPRARSSRAAGPSARPGSERWVKPRAGRRGRLRRVDARRPRPPRRRSRACATDKPASAITREPTAAAPRRRRRRRRAERQQRQGHEPRARHRPVHRPHQARPGALLRERRRLDAAAPEGPAGVAGARARAASPASCSSRSTPRDAACPGMTRARPGAVARPRRAAGGRQRRGAGRARRR